MLRAAHDAAEEERRRARVEVEAVRAEATAELGRRRDEVDELERRAAERLRLADDEAAATVAAARVEAEEQSASVRAGAEARLSSLLQLQESLRVQLVEASQELRRSLESLGSAGSAPAVADIGEPSASVPEARRAAPTGRPGSLAAPPPRMGHDDPMGSAPGGLGRSRAAPVSAPTTVSAPV